MTTSYSLLCITTAATLSILLASFNENIHVQARVYEEKSKRRLFTRRASSFAKALLGTSAIFNYQRAGAQNCKSMVQKYNCQSKNVGPTRYLTSGSITTRQACGTACLQEAKKYTSENGCCHFRDNAKDGYPCLYVRKAGVKSASRTNRWAGNCVGAPANCLTTGCGTNQVCNPSGSTYVCQCKNGYYKYGSTCTACTVCSGNTIQTSSCTQTSNRQCSACTKPSYSSFTSNSGCAWKCNSGYYKYSSYCYQCAATCTGHTYESTTLHLYPKPRMHTMYEAKRSIVEQLQWLWLDMQYRLL